MSFTRLWRGSEAISPAADKSQTLNVEFGNKPASGNPVFQSGFRVPCQKHAGAGKPGMTIHEKVRMDYQAIPGKKRLTPDNMGIGGALGGFLLTNGPIIFSMAVLKTITTDT